MLVAMNLIKVIYFQIACYSGFLSWAQWNHMRSEKAEILYRWSWGCGRRWSQNDLEHMDRLWLNRPHGKPEKAGRLRSKEHPSADSQQGPQSHYCKTEDFFKDSNKPRRESSPGPFQGNTPHPHLQLHPPGDLNFCLVRLLSKGSGLAHPDFQLTEMMR